MVICLERYADLHMAQLMPLPLTVSCSNKIQIGFTFLVLADLGSPGQRPLNVCVLNVCVFASKFGCCQVLKLKKYLKLLDTDINLLGKTVNY